MKIYPYSDIKHFKKVFNVVSSLLNNIEDNSFFSLYSIHPIISQILGVTTPLMGSGESPYSIISMIFSLGEKSLFCEVAKIPFKERRIIVDEFYTMIAPLLLEDEDEYVNLIMNTSYKELGKKNVNKFQELKRNLIKKFSILRKFNDEMSYQRGGFAQIAHYGQIEDLYKEYEFLEDRNEDVFGEWFNSSYPIVNEFFITNFPDYNSKTNRKVVGYVIFVSNSTQQILKDGKLRKNKILQCAHLAEKLGVDIVGMAGLIASFSKGGEGLSKKIPTLGFTTGHAFTVGNIVNILDTCLIKVNRNIKKSVVAIVGAGGSIGCGCAELVAERSPKKLILIDVSSFVGAKNLSKTKEKVEKCNSFSEVVATTDLNDVKKADIVICATNSIQSIINKEHLKIGAIVVDDSFPKNVSQEILDERDDIILLEGGITKLPAKIDIYAARNMPDLMDAPLTRAFSCKEVYGCFAEVLILALQGCKTNYGLGYADIKLAKEILEAAKNFGISTAPLQCYDRVVEDIRFENSKKFSDY